MEDMDGKRFLFEVYSDTNTHIKGCKKNYTGEVVQGRHKTYRYKNTKHLKKIEKKLKEKNTMFKNYPKMSLNLKVFYENSLSDFNIF